MVQIFGGGGGRWISCNDARLKMPDAPEDLVSSWWGRPRFRCLVTGGHDPPVPCRKDKENWRHDELGGVFFLMFTPTSTWGNDPINLTNIFQMS